MGKLATLEALRASKSYPARQAAKQIDALRAGLRQLRDRGANDQHVERVRQEGLTAIRKDLVAANVAETQRIADTLGHLGETWAKQRERDDKADRRVATYERRLRAMTAAELDKEVDRVMDNGLGVDPSELDALSAAVQGRGIHEPLRKWLTTNGYDRPWEHTVPGADLVADLKAAAADPSAIHLRDGDGRRFAQDIRDVWDGLDYEAADRGGADDQ
jgi:hypothetical protein